MSLSLSQTVIKGLPICDGSLFLNPTPPPATVEKVTMWGPGRTLIYPWQTKNSSYPPAVAGAPLNARPAQPR